MVNKKITGKLAILAGRGSLPREIIAICKKEQIDFLVISFQGQTEEETIKNLPYFEDDLSKPSKILKKLHSENVKNIIMAGSLKRPSFLRLMLDPWARKLLKHIGSQAFGDNGLLKGIIEELEIEGFTVLSIDHFLPNMLAPAGIIGALQPTKEDWDDIKRGKFAAKLLGELDIGQGVVVQQGVILAVEAIEGTDEMLKRCKNLQMEGKGGVLVKTIKPQQERRADLPSIGPDTVINAVESGLRGIAVESGSSLLLQREKLIKIANKHKLFIIAF